MLDNNTESYLIMKIQKTKGIESGKKNNSINYEEIKNNDENISKPQKRKRTDSVDLYKKHKKVKEKKNKNLKGNSKNDIASENINLNENNKKSNKNEKNDKEKKVHFPKKFVTIIDIESYKKYNEENTSKDPFEYMGINNKKEENKERLNCSCLIY